METAPSPGAESDSGEENGLIPEEDRKPYDPAGVHEIKDKLKKRLDAALEGQGYSTRRCGPQTELEPSYFDESGGFWNPGRLSKPPRWLFNLSTSDERPEAALSTHEKNDQLGYYNIRKGEIAGVTARAVPVTQKPDGSFVCLETWEWLIFVFFEEALEEGSSSEMIYGFAPPSYDLRYQGDPVSPLGVHLYALCDPESEVEVAGEQISYAEATQALTRLFEAGESELQSSPAEDASGEPGAAPNLTLDFGDTAQ